ncbi:BTAD domain-containing putative transcriptional regulator [Actinoplanes sp. N902-109]|uniref:BTAD domain-containing putative transcriptional regulator n=1 Tax=Actinoplanes sp. (strain N902-109) TaxID=649831 RepID=UPI000329631E|nr:BTAD domain-containing putative transcriptional regulator [Actinoplanes sp. N902-109]AGL14190.1 transcriptional regulator, winged helix family [Actinoplanes sp. N902-109]
MRITTFGPLAVDGTPVRGERLAAVIRELVDARGRAVSSGALVDAVWQGDPPEDATGAVQALISRVRRLGVPVLAVPGGYRTPADQVETDGGLARTLVDRSRAALRDGDPASARTAADEARALFPEVPELPGAEAARLFAEVVTVRAECALAGAGAFDEDDLRRLTARTPPDEPAAALLVRVLAAQGRDAEALDVVERLRADLADRYGTDPSPVITDVHLALLRGELTIARPRRVIRSAMPASWRRPGTALVGRDRDLAAVEADLVAAPLVTVVATGGAGKTRLAAEVTRRASGAVRVVELAGVRTPEEVLPAVLSAVGGTETTTVLSAERRVLSPRDRLRTAAAELNALLVLDNCEHVLDAAAQVVADLLGTAPEVTVLATSRAPLGLAGEVVHRLETLPDTEALALLEARARAGGALSTWDTGRALELCHRLDNLPLALELAAARLRHMPIDDVLAGLSDRFALLDDALRGLPDRHASLWAMVDWSRELLANDERELLQRLAVIPAPFTAATAAAVAGRTDVRRGLAVLVEQSLLVLEANGGPPRYRMLETVREYGEARLDDRGPAMAGLVSWARGTAVELSAHLIGPRQLETLAAVARDQENLLAALRWAMSSGDEAAAVDVAAPVFYVLMIRGLHLEVSTWAQPMLHVEDIAARRRSALVRGAGADPSRLVWVLLLILINSGITGPVRLSVLAGRALRAVLQKHAAEVSPRNAALAELLPLLHRLPSAEARATAERLATHEDPYVRAYGLFAWSAIREMVDGSDPADAAEQAYRSFEAAGDNWGMGMTAQGIGSSVRARADGTAVEWLARSVRHMEMVGAAQDARSMRLMLDIQLALEGDADAEHRLRDAALTDQGQDWDQAQAYLGLANIAWQRQDWAEMQRCADQIVLAARDLNDPQPQQRVMFRIAAAVLQLAAAAGHPAPRADATAVALLTQARADSNQPGLDVPLIGAWAVGGALLAQHRGQLELARELWKLGMSTGANMRTMFPPAQFTRLAAPLASEDHRRIPVPEATARIRELMTELL